MTTADVIAIFHRASVNDAHGFAAAYVIEQAIRTMTPAQQKRAYQNYLTCIGLDKLKEREA